MFYLWLLETGICFQLGNILHAAPHWVGQEESCHEYATEMFVSTTNCHLTGTVNAKSLSSPRSKESHMNRAAAFICDPLLLRFCPGSAGVCITADGFKAKTSCEWTPWVTCSSESVFLDPVSCCEKQKLLVGHLEGHQIMNKLVQMNCLLHSV